MTLKETLVNALVTSPQGDNRSQTKVNYFIGNDKSKWKTNIPTYNTVSLGKVYKGIDLYLKAYGETVEKAIEDLRYKITDRDTSRYSSWKLTDVRPVDEVIQAYRVITGACEMGVRQFVEAQGKLPEKISLKEVIKRTKESYGSKEFARFFK